MLDTFRKSTPEVLEAIHEEMKLRKTNEVFLLFVMGSQFDHLIFRALAKLGIYCLVADPASVIAEDVRALAPTGIIISGGPASVHTEPPPFDSAIFDLGIPTLGICLGFQMWTKHIGVAVTTGKKSELGVHSLIYTGNSSPLLVGVPPLSKVLQSHGDEISSTSPMLRVHGFSDYRGERNADNIVAVASHEHLYGVQFHPEVSDTEYGPQIFENFCFSICGAKDRFPAGSVAKQKVAQLREQIKEKRVLVLTSGGSDSSVCNYLVKDAVAGGDQHHALYLKGLDRPDDEAFVLRYFDNKPWIKLHVIDGTDEFLRALAGKVTMREKRLAMRGVYDKLVRMVVERVSEGGKYEVVVVQGTLYTDLSESGHGYASGARKAQIKQHHNVGNDFGCKEFTPLDDCVKDNARDIGRELGVPEELLIRHPFPGPGLAVRIEGEVTREKLAMERQADGIYIEELRRAGLYEMVWQAGPVLSAAEHTFSKGDDAGSGPVIMLWAVWSVNGFTAQAAQLPWDFLKGVARRIGNEVKDVGAVSYRISDKPFSTIECG